MTNLELDPSHNFLIEYYPALRSVPQTELERVLRNARPVRLKAGATVFEELQTCHAFPFVLSGRLKVVKRSENGREIFLYQVGPGDACVVTSACLLGNKPYNAVGIVQEDCEILGLPARDFNQLMAFDNFREFIFSLFSKRVLDLMHLIDEVAFRRLDQRLARWLLHQGPVVEMSHQNLADELGTVREIVTRTLNHFAELQLLRLSRGKIHIINKPGLEKIFPE